MLGGWNTAAMHKQTDMIEIETEDGEHLTLTGTHNVFYYEDGKATPTYAKNLESRQYHCWRIRRGCVHILTIFSTVKF